MNRRLNPMMEQCLRAMARSSLEQGPDGWIPVDGRPGCWNTHTVKWLDRVGYCRVVTQTRRPLAKITTPGRIAVGQIDMVEYA